MANHPLLWILLAVFLDGTAAFAGGLLPLGFLKRHLAALLAFAAGTLLAVAFLELLPDASAAMGSADQSMPWAMAGFCAFYAVDRIMEGHAQKGHGTLGPFLLVGDALHNLGDGMAIAAAFLLNFQAGITATLAIIIHEVPQEIGDYAVLVSQGYTRMQAFGLLFLVQLTSLFGALAVYGASGIVLRIVPALLAMAAGGFLYVAAVDLLPQLAEHRQPEQSRWGAPVAFLGGILLIALLRSTIG